MFSNITPALLALGLDEDEALHLIECCPYLADFDSLLNYFGLTQADIAE